MVSPDRVRFRGIAGEPLATKVRLTPAAGVSMTITAVHAMNGKDIRITLDPPPGTPSKGYLLTVTSTKTAAGEIHDAVTIFTSIAEKPKLTIPITGVVLDR